MRASVAVGLSLFAVSCGAAASPATLDRLHGYGFVGAGGETVEELEARSRSSHLAAADESAPAIVEADGLLRALLPALLDRLDDPRAATLAARLRALPAARTWDDVARIVESLGPALEIWEPGLPPGELARFADNPSVAHAAAPLSGRTAVVVAIHSIGNFIGALRGAGASGTVGGAGREQHLCPAELADLAILTGAPREQVREVVHRIVRDVRVADVSASPTSRPVPPCMPGRVESSPP